jgi:hypothetical protein
MTHDDRRRDAAVERLAGVDCPVCWRGVGLTCCYVPLAEWVLLDFTHQQYGHHERVQRALRTGTADRADVVAVLGDSAPAWLSELSGPDDADASDTTIGERL